MLKKHKVAKNIPLPYPNRMSEGDEPTNTTKMIMKKTVALCRLSNNTMFLKKRKFKTSKPPIHRTNFNIISPSILTIEQ